MESCPWKQIQRYLIQLEIVNVRYNIIARHLFPSAMFCALYSSVITAVAILRINWKLMPHIPPSFGYFAMSGICMCSVFIGYSYYRLGEILVSESNETLSAFQFKVEQAEAKRQEGLDRSLRRTMKFSRRMFRRQPLVIRLWFFMTVTAGMAFAFLQSVLDNILTGVLMVNINAPVHLF